MLGGGGKMRLRGFIGLDRKWIHLALDPVQWAAVVILSGSAVTVLTNKEFAGFLGCNF